MTRSYSALFILSLCAAPLVSQTKNIPPLRVVIDDALRASVRQSMAMAASLQDSPGALLRMKALKGW